jgi:hypothetical protein
MNNLTSSQQTYISPQPLGLPRGHISQITDQTALMFNKQLNFKHKKLKEALSFSKGKGKIVYVDAVLGYNSPYLEASSQGFTVFISLDSSPLRDRIDMACAIGMYLLYCIPLLNNRKDALIRIDHETDPQVITEAQWFGASLLMPAEDYISVYFQKEGNHLLISDYFQVPIRHSQNRMMSLKNKLDTHVENF